MANGLINLQTDLKSLRYGNDKPYITKNIGQAPGSQIGLEVQTRIDDTSRIAQMLIDKPGIKYLLNEALLQQVNIDDKIRNRGNKTVAGAVLGQLGNTLVGTAKILGSTLAQVPVNGTGLHFLKGFRTDTYLQPSNGNQASGFAQFFGAGGVEGAQYALKGEEVPGKVTTQFINNKGNVVSPQGADPKFTYNAPVKKDGDQGTNWNEKPNNQIVDRLPPLLNSAIAKNGGVINVTNTYQRSVQGETIQGPDGESIELPATAAEARTPETTAQPLELGRSNQLGEADQGELLPDNGNNGKQKFNSGNTYTETDTAINTSTILNRGKTAGVGTQKRIYIGGKDVSGASTDKLAKEDSNLALIQYADKRGIIDLISFPTPMGIDELYRVSSSQEIAKIPSGSVQDFRQKFGDTYSFDYNNIKIKRETRVNLGDQGRQKAKGFYKSYSTKDDLAIDKLNALDISDTRIDGTEQARDLAKLYFEIITPDGSKFLHFRAFIDSIDDTYNADWQGNKYVGRAENFYTYNGFERDISISFKIAAATRSEMKPLYRKMVYLASSTAPTYGGQGFMRGSLAKITVGSYLSQIPGVITSVKFNLIDGMPWEIAMQNPEAGTDDDVQELPMGLQCNVSFKAIHDFAPQTGLQHYFTNPKPVNGSQPFF
jgi:hypothetical protein